MAQRAAIAIENVSKRFGDGRPALDSVSLAVKTGEFVRRELEAIRLA